MGLGRLQIGGHFLSNWNQSLLLLCKMERNFLTIERSMGDLIKSRKEMAMVTAINQHKLSPLWNSMLALFHFVVHPVRELFIFIRSPSTWPYQRSGIQTRHSIQGVLAYCLLYAAATAVVPRIVAVRTTDRVVHSMLTSNLTAGILP